MTRKMKIQPNYVANSKNRSTGFVIRPKLTLSGKWMEEAGFLPSTFINVHVENGTITITTA
jgi:hypothetical protein